MNYRWAIAFKNCSTFARQNVVRKAILGATEAHAPPKGIQIFTKDAVSKPANQSVRMPTLRWAAGATESCAPPKRM